MTIKKPVSDEILNAFVDGQLAQEEKEQLFALLADDPELNKQVCVLRNSRELIQMAYQNPPEPPSALNRKITGVSGMRSYWVTGLAASILLGLGMLIGLQLNSNTPATDKTEPLAVQTGGVQRLIGTDKVKIKVLFHLNTRDREVAREALDELENVLNYYRRTGQRAQIGLITNGGGIDLLRTDTSPYPRRILAMQQAYPNLTFVACQNTIDRIKREQGITARLLPGTVVIDSVVAQIMRRQQQGWAYIQV